MLHSTISRPSKISLNPKWLYRYSSIVMKEPNWHTISTKFNKEYIPKMEQLKNKILTENHPEDVKNNFLNVLNTIKKLEVLYISDEDRCFNLRDKCLMENYVDLTLRWSSFIDSNQGIFQKNLCDQDAIEIEKICERISYSIHKFDREIIGISDEICGIKMTESEFLEW